MKKANGNNNNPYFRQIILSASCAVLSLVVLAVATAAWFSRNTQVGAANLNIQVDPEANLVIKKSGEESQWGTNVEFGGASVALTPVTHRGNGKYLLQYCTNPLEISKTTGYNSENDAALADVTDDVISKTGRTYFKDFTVLIASENKAFTNQTLTASIALSPPSGGLAEHDPRYAASVDVWVGSTDNADHYKETLRYVGGETPAEGTSNTVEILQNGTIPMTTDSPITVILRCYFDGKLEEVGSTGNAYIRTSTLTLENVGITVTFTASDSVQGSTP